MVRKPYLFLFVMMVLALAPMLPPALAADFDETSDVGDHTAPQVLALDPGLNTITGTLADGDDVDAYAFTLPVQAAMRLTVRKAADDMQLYIINNSGQCVGYNDDVFSEAFPSIRLGLPVGTYRVLVLDSSNLPQDAGGTTFDFEDHLCDESAGPLASYTGALSPFAIGGDYILEVDATPTLFTPLSDDADGNDTLATADDLGALANGDNYFRSELSGPLDGDIFSFSVARHELLTVLGYFIEDGASDMAFSIADSAGNCIAANDDDYQDDGAYMPRIDVSLAPGDYYLLAATWSNDAADADGDEFADDFPDQCNDGVGPFDGFAGDGNAAVGSTGRYGFSISGSGLSGTAPDCSVVTNEDSIEEENDNFRIGLNCGDTQFGSAVFGFQGGIDPSGAPDVQGRDATSPWRASAFVNQSTSPLVVNVDESTVAVSRRADLDSGDDTPGALANLRYQSIPIEVGTIEASLSLQTVLCETLTLSDVNGSPIPVTCGDLTFDVRDDVDAQFSLDIDVSTDGDITPAGLLRVDVLIFDSDFNYTPDIQSIPPTVLPADGLNTLTFQRLETGEDGNETPIYLYIDTLGHIVCRETFGAGLDLPDLPLTTLINGDSVVFAGDADNDEDIDADDADLIVAEFGNTPFIDDDFDINADGEINVLDLVHVGRNFGLGNGLPLPCDNYTSSTFTPPNSPVMLVDEAANNTVAEAVAYGGWRSSPWGSRTDANARRSSKAND